MDYADGSFHTPLERITDAMALEIATTNQEFLQLTRPKVEILRQWNINPGVAIVSVTKMMEELEGIRAKLSHDTESTLDKLFEKVLSQLTGKNLLDEGCANE